MSTYLTTCAGCGGRTSKHYARSHAGQCKACATGGETTGAKCPDCGGPISSWALSRGYHCNACTRQADPEGYANEARGMYNDPDY